MIIFPDPKGYSLTFGMIFDDDQRLNTNHNHALEMTFWNQNQYLDLVINWLVIQNDHVWRPQRAFIDLRYDVFTISYYVQRQISNHSYALEMIYGGLNYSQNLSKIAWKPKIIVRGDPVGYVFTFAVLNNVGISNSVHSVSNKRSNLNDQTYLYSMETFHNPVITTIQISETI